MEEVFFSEPGRTKYEIKEGMVFITAKSGRRKLVRCTPIPAFRDELRLAQRLLQRLADGQKDITVTLREG